jgi:hypothetical protein
LLKDPSSETQYEFSLKETLEKTSESNKAKLMEGLKVYATPSVKPPPEEMMEILEAAGAEFCKNAPSECPNPKQYVVIGASEDADLCRDLASKGFSIHSNEFVLTGILRQRLDYERYVFLT